MYDRLCPLKGLNWTLVTNIFYASTIPRNQLQHFVCFSLRIQFYIKFPVHSVSRNISNKEKYVTYTIAPLSQNASLKIFIFKNTGFETQHSYKYRKQYISNCLERVILTNSCIIFSECYRQYWMQSLGKKYHIQGRSHEQSRIDSIWSSSGRSNWIVEIKCL